MTCILQLFILEFGHVACSTLNTANISYTNE